MNVRNFRVGVKTVLGLARRHSEKIPADVLLKTADVNLKTANLLLKTADVLLKTADVLLKTADLHFGVPGAEGSSRRLVVTDGGRRSRKKVFLILLNLWSYKVHDK